MTDTTTTDGTLAGLRVLDVSEGIPGAHCTKLLADAGADVVKVEPPGAGDPSRAWNSYPHDEPAGEPGLLFWYLQANKRGVTLDLTSGEGQAILCRLLPHYDVVVESWSPREAPVVRKAIDALEADAARLIRLSVTPFGLTGPYAAYEATDLVIQAAAGWMAEGGAPDREPLKTAGNISGYITGMYGAVAVMAAWTWRQSGGTGQHIDLSSFEAVQSTSGYGALGYSFTGVRTGSRAGQRFPFAIIPCKDGWIGVNILTPAQWQGLTDFMGRPELRDDPRFATSLARRGHSDELTEILTCWAREHTARDLFQANEQRVPLTLLPTVADLLEFPQHTARGFLVEQPFGEGVVRRPGAPFRMSATPLRLRRSAPVLGQHNSEIYRDLIGLSQSQMTSLRDHKVI